MRITLSLFPAAMMLLAGQANADSTITRSVLAAGGAAAGSAHHAIHATIGQPLTAVAGSAHHSIAAGFWAIVAIPCPGDVNGDAVVDLVDLTMLLGNFGLTSGATLADGDLDADGDVDLSDLTFLLANFGATCS